MSKIDTSELTMVELVALQDEIETRRIKEKKKNEYIEKVKAVIKDYWDVTNLFWF